MEDCPSTAPLGSLEASSPAPMLRPGSTGTYRRLANGDRPRLQLSILPPESASQTKRKLTPQFSASGRESSESGAHYTSDVAQASLASSYSALNFADMLQNSDDSAPTTCGDDLPDVENLCQEKGRHSSFEHSADARCEHVRDSGRVVEIGSLGDGAIHTKKRRKVVGLDDESDSYRSSSMGEPTLAGPSKEMSGIQALLERWVNSSTTALVLKAEEQSE